MPQLVGRYGWSPNDQPCLCVIAPDGEWHCMTKAHGRHGENDECIQGES